MMKKEKYLLIDTNVYIQCCALELIEGDDINVLKELHTLLDKNELKLLLPEVVELELQNVLNDKLENLKKVINGYKEKINTDNALDEKIKKDFTESIGQLLAEREKNSKEVMKELNDIFSHKNTIKKELKLTPEIFLSSFKYFFHKSKPWKSYNDQRDVRSLIQSDCLIIETAKKYLIGKKNYILYLCSNNVSDFSKETKTISTKRGLDISEDIGKHFEKIEYYRNLLVFLKKIFKIKVSEKSINKFAEQLNELVQKELQKKLNELQGLNIDLTPLTSDLLTQANLIDVGTASDLQTKKTELNHKKKIKK